MAGYPIPARDHEHELVIKQSRFIACVAAVADSAAAQQFLLRVKQRWPGASHYCTAAIAGAPEDSQSYACSDDGEPSGTAGRPMLNVLLNQRIGEIAVVVVRYFGGIKLGTGGLQRAYTQVVVESLKSLPVSHRVVRRRYQLRCDYADQSAVDYVLHRHQAMLIASDYGASIHLTISLEPEKRDMLDTDLLAQTQGRVQTEATG
ncbi:YigZ family protein [Idiomarina xiamenensis]|uniref:Impact N-terminal domain-containing protein n=1 Tax=Idiomarina xiamenensis 10-D-4 TaxID=740709 RepID=K2KA25_9GAMM|nr:YigZ family protein [Idiomarina xiamenensis]EKE83377.1 hypothetical protein A10D4_08147 [Idiomarina xiamenensis 10-D-4]